MKTHHVAGVVMTFLIAVWATAAPAEDPEPRPFKGRTKVVDHALETWEFECPDGTVIDLMSDAIPVDALEAVSECFSSIESENGVTIKSRTIVEDGVVVSDVIETTVCMTAAQAQKLCGLVDGGAGAETVAACSRPGIFSVLEDGLLTELLLVLPDGRGLDVLGLGEEGPLFGDLLAFVQAAEVANGVSVSDVSRVSGGRLDHARQLSISYLRPADLEALGGLLAGHGLQIAPSLGVYEADAQFRVRVGRGNYRVSLAGEVVLRRGEPAGGSVPVELVEMALVSEEPVPARLGLSEGVATAGQLTGCPADGAGQLALDYSGRFDLPGGLALESVAPVPLAGRTRGCCWGGWRPVRLKHEGLSLFVAEGKPLRAKVSLSFREGAPLVVLEIKEPPRR